MKLYEQLELQQVQSICVEYVISIFSFCLLVINIQVVGLLGIILLAVYPLNILIIYRLKNVCKVKGVIKRKLLTQDTFNLLAHVLIVLIVRILYQNETSGVIVLAIFIIFNAALITASLYPLTKRWCCYDQARFKPSLENRKSLKKGSSVSGRKLGVRNYKIRYVLILALLVLVTTLGLLGQINRGYFMIILVLSVFAIITGFLTINVLLKRIQLEQNKRNLKEPKLRSLRKSSRQSKLDKLLIVLITITNFLLSYAVIVLLLICLA